MKKRILTMIFALVLCLVMLSPALATASSAENTGLTATESVPETTVPSIPDQHLLPRLVDDADLLDEDEESELLARLDDISIKQDCDVAIVTVNSLDGKSAKAYADDFFDYNGYGMGSDDDGILFLISMGERQWAITTFGTAISAFSDAGQELIMDDVKPYLSNGDYERAFNQFAEQCDAFLTQANNGAPYDIGNMPGNDYIDDSYGNDYYGSDSYSGGVHMPLWSIPLSLVIGAVIALITTLIMKGKLKSVRRQSTASNYIRNGSFKLTGSSDTFLRSYVSRTEIPRDNDSGGGSSTNFSSSGRSHGGSSGSF